MTRKRTIIKWVVYLLMQAVEIVLTLTLLSSIKSYMEDGGLNITYIITMVLVFVATGYIGSQLFKLVERKWYSE